MGSKSLIAKPDASYSVDGDDLSLNLDIDFPTSILGGTLRTEVLGSEMYLSIPRAVRDGDILVYPGLGWTKESRLTITFRVGDPGLSEDQKRKIAEILGHDPTPREESVQPEK